VQRRVPKTWDFPHIIKFRIAAHTISEKAIQFRHPDYNPDQAQKLISSSMSRHLSTHNISPKSMHVFSSNLANRQTTDKRMRTNAFISSLSEVKNHQMHLPMSMQQSNLNRKSPAKEKEGVKLTELSIGEAVN